MQPLVSILFPCYNSEKHLKYALESILNQDYKTLEVICVNDGSTDNTLKMLEFYREKDNRIVIVNNPGNLGLIESLNRSFTYINGEYFARMDADDYCPPNRISTQLDFLQKNTWCDLVSTSYYYFRKDDTRLEYVPPVGHLGNSLKFISVFSTPLTHASVLGKTSLIKSGKYFYDKDFPHSEDFELFSRMAWQNVAMTNIKDPLYWVRLSSGSVSAVYNDIQIKTHSRITRRNLKEFLGVSDEVNETLLKVMTNRIDRIITLDELKKGLSLLKTYYGVAEKKLSLNGSEKQEIKSYLNLQRLNIILQSNKIRFKVLKWKNTGYFLSSLFLLKVNQVPLIIKKIRNSVFY
jgi:glycosyltransferase involved in cell wall biosynthesis